MDNCVLSRSASTELSELDFYTLLHSKHDRPVYIGNKDHTKKTKTQAYKWNQKRVNNQDISKLKLSGNTDTYMSMNGFDYNIDNRKASNVGVITSLWCDIDYYKIPGLSGKSYLEVYDKIKRENQWLPTPTILSNSGQGLYLIYVFKQPLSMKNRVKWEVAIKRLIELLSQYNSDSACKDLSRVLRIPHTKNHANNEPVRFYQIGQKTSLEKLASSIRLQYRTAFKPVKETFHKVSPIDEKRVEKRLEQDPVNSNHNELPSSRRQQSAPKLWRNRVKDIRSLILYRGKIDHDRYQTSYVLAVAMFNIEPSNREKRYKGFCRLCKQIIKIDAQLYIRKQTKFINQLFIGKEDYLSNENIIGRLKVTDIEIEKCFSHIGKPKKRTFKRSQDEISTVKQENIKKAIEMKQNKVANCDIAKALNVTRGTVTKYLKNKRPQ